MKAFYIHLNTQNFDVLSRIIEYLKLTDTAKIKIEFLTDIQYENIVTIECYDLTKDERNELLDIFQQYDIDITFIK